MEESLCDSSSERFALGDLRRSTNTKGIPISGMPFVFPSLWGGKVLWKFGLNYTICWFFNFSAAFS